MTTQATTGDKTEFWLHDGTALVELGEIVDVPEFPSGTRELINATHHKSGSYMDYITAPHKDGNEVTIVMNLIPGSATETLCEAAAAASASRAYKIGYWNAAGIKRQKTGTCIVRDYRGKNPMDDRRTAELTIKWTSDAVDAVFA